MKGVPWRVARGVARGVAAGAWHEPKLKAGPMGCEGGSHGGCTHLGHEPKVKEDQSSVIGEHQIALVGIRMHDPRHDEARRHRLDRHVGHAQPFSAAQRLEMAAVDPFGDEDARALRVPEGGGSHGV